MKLSVIRVVQKYLRIYSIFLRFSLIRSTQYRVSFFIELIIELGYQVILILFYKVIYANVDSIAGWSYYQALFLTGLSIISSELLLGLVYIFNIKTLPSKIKNGDLDLSLLMPVNSLFNNSLSMPYFTSIITILPGIYLIGYASIQLQLSFNVINILGSLVIFGAGLLIGYSILVLFSSLSFIFINGTSFPRIGENIITNYHSNPHTVYTGIIRIIFLYIFPITFIASIPASTIVHGINIKDLLLAVGLASFLLCLTIFVWKRLIKLYSSASS